MINTTPLRMSAYYYTFERTGVESIDRILSAVASAGKAFHSTEEWQEDADGSRYGHRGATPVEWVQNAANDAAGMVSWQPIDTAPKDGTTVLIAFMEYGVGPGRRVASAAFHGDPEGDEFGWKSDANDKMSFFPPTHWMPLPDPPQPEGAR